MIDAAHPAFLAASGLATGAGVVVGAAACVPFSLYAARALRVPEIVARLGRVGAFRFAGALAMACLGIAASVMLGVNPGWTLLGTTSLLIGVGALLAGLLLMAIAPVAPVRSQEQAVVVKAIRPGTGDPAASKPAKPARPEPRKAA